jgi:hypothetical protein
MLLYLPLWFYPSAGWSYLLFSLCYGHFVLWYLAGLLLAGSLLFALKTQALSSLLMAAIGLYGLGYTLQQLGNLHLFSGQIDRLLNWGPSTRNFLLASFPMLSIGYWLKHSQWAQRWRPSLPLLLAAVLLVLLESDLNYRWISHSEPVEFLLSILLAAPLIFIYVNQLNLQGRSKQLAQLSTAMFLVHPIGMHLYQQMALPLPRVGFVLLFSVLASALLLRLNQNIKYLL